MLIVEVAVAIEPVVVVAVVVTVVVVAVVIITIPVLPLLQLLQQMIRVVVVVVVVVVAVAAVVVVVVVVVVVDPLARTRPPYHKPALVFDGVEGLGLGLTLRGGDQRDPQGVTDGPVSSANTPSVLPAPNVLHLWRR